MSTAATSREALAGMTAKKLKASQEKVLAVMKDMHARGQVNATLTELADGYNTKYQTKYPMASGAISPRVGELIAGGYLERVDESQARRCSITGKSCRPVYAVARQEDLL